MAVGAVVAPHVVHRGSRGEPGTVCRGEREFPDPETGAQPSRLGLDGQHARRSLAPFPEKTCRPAGTRWPLAAGQPTPCVTFRLVVAPLRGPGRSPVLPFACCVGSLLSVGRCGRCSCWCRFRVRDAQ